VSDIPAIDDKDRIELYRMEYVQCVSCYQDLYNSIWRIFSYVSAVTAAVLVFGTKYLTISGTVLVSTIPLLIWFLFIYLPMDKYGRLRTKRLAEIEKKLGGDLKHFTQVIESKQWKWPFWGAWRVLYGVCMLGIVLSIILTWSAWGVKAEGFRKSEEPSRFQGEMQVTSPVQIELRNPTGTSQPPSAKTK
jgi:hypothetical protein